MANKVPTKITVGGKTVAAALKTMAEDEVKILCVIAGVVERYRLKHSDYGSGVIFSGAFGACDPEYTAADIQAMQESKVLLLPVDIASSLQKVIDKGNGQQVRFKANVGLKKSSRSSQGYFLKMEYRSGPEVIGQMDLVRELMQEEEVSVEPTE